METGGYLETHRWMDEIPVRSCRKFRAPNGLVSGNAHLMIHPICESVIHVNLKCDPRAISVSVSQRPYEWNSGRIYFCVDQKNRPQYILLHFSEVFENRNHFLRRFSFVLGNGEERRVIPRNSRKSHLIATKSISVLESGTETFW